MCQHVLKDLGFVEVELPPGAHICQIYSNAQERNESLLKFLQAGVLANEKCASFSDAVNESTVREFFDDQKMSYQGFLEESKLATLGAHEVYFQENQFVPERMLGMLEEFYNQSVDLKLPGARVIGEMSPEVNNIPGGSRLMEYESRVNLLLSRIPVTAVCQYNADEFDGATIMEVLKVHPLMVVNGAVLSNPFYVEPEVYLEHD